LTFNILAQVIEKYKGEMEEIEIQKIKTIIFYASLASNG
jgi:bifunctional DNase/RNase